MSSYLHVICGPYRLLLDTTSILEILEVDEESDSSQEASDHRIWRNKTLPLVRFRDLLELPDSGKGAVEKLIVYQESEDSSPFLLSVDSVVRLEHLNDNSFMTLPPLPEKVTRLFDRVYPDKVTGKQVYRCRKKLLS